MEIDINSLKIEGVDMKDYPDFCDAYIVSGDYEDGTPIPDEIIQKLNDENSGLINELIFDKHLYGC